MLVARAGTRLDDAPIETDGSVEGLYDLEEADLGG
jgi:hypothetical protein